jgi:primosomal protein N'
VFLYKVAPLIKVNRREEETFLYYGTKNLPCGSLIRINFKNREINGVVLNSIPLIEKKLEIKKAGFATKKISVVISFEPVLFDWQIKLAQWMSRYYLHPLGDTLRLFLPRSLLDKKRKINLPSSGIPLIKNTGKKKNLIIWENKKERWLKYLEIIKQEKALICFPEIIQLEEFRDFLKKLCPNLNFLVFHGKLSPKQEFEVWEKTKRGKFSVILGTRSAIFLPFQSLTSIIIDEEENPSHKSWDQQPRYDVREIVKKIKEIKKIQLIKGVEIPRIQTYLKLKERPKRKFHSLIKIIQIKNKKVIFEEETLNLIKRHSEKQFIFLVNRRGLAPAVLCQDCGHFLICPNCDNPLALVGSTLYCHYCSSNKKMGKFCPECQSWRLKTLGFGAEMIKKELQKITSLKKIEVFDSYNLPSLELTATFYPP